jgi:hypothetical protein
MGWIYSPGWKSRQDVRDHYEHLLAAEGCHARWSGCWVLLEKDGKAIDLTHVKIANSYHSGWGYKSASVAHGPYVFTAPPTFVKKVYPVFKGNEYFQSWLEKYPKRASVLKFYKEKA